MIRPYFLAVPFYTGVILPFFIKKFIYFFYIYTGMIRPYFLAFFFFFFYLLAPIGLILTIRIDTGVIFFFFFFFFSRSFLYWCDSA